VQPYEVAMRILKFAIQAAVIANCKFDEFGDLAAGRFFPEFVDCNDPDFIG
jgi:hypothetical protein